jgi:uncharacterized protein YndB with AHSA1/START domain
LKRRREERIFVNNPDHSILKVRRSILLSANPQRVWREFTSKEDMDRWWGAIISEPVAGTPAGQHLVIYEPNLGGRIVMEVSMDGEPARYGGVIDVFAAGREFGFENDWIPNRGWNAPTYMSIRLTPALDGTLVELFHHGFERTGGNVAAEHAGYEQGWGMTQLNALKRVVESIP